MSVALPKVVDYNEPMYSLPPNTQSFQVVCNPISGSSFTPSSQIDIDLGSRGFMDPKSLMIRYKITTANAAEAYIVGTPVYTPFLRVSTMMNSQTVETINNYNVVANMLTNLNRDLAQKLGEAYSYGYNAEALNATTVPTNNEQTDGGVFAANGSKSLSAPLICSLSQCEKLVPLNLLNGIRLTFTLDSIVNMFSTISNVGATPAYGFTNPANYTPGAVAVAVSVPGTAGTAVAVPTNYTISNFEVVYNCIDFGDEVKNMVASMDRIRIKSQTWASSVQTLASGASGQQNLIYNHKFSSVKSLFLNMGGANRAISANGNMDSYNVAGATGDYQFICGQQSIPQRVLSCNNNYGGILQSLRQAIGSVFDKNNAMSINSVEFGRALSDAVTWPILPCKFIVGVSTEKIKVPGSFFTGISTEASPISAIININTPTSQIHNAMLIVNADLVYEIDPQTKQVVVIQ